ncbi:MAG: hypothetical protein V5A72_01525 [Candidatus Nanohaloarchaea archaeon]
MADKLFPDKEKKDDNGEKEVEKESRGYSYNRDGKDDVRGPGLISRSLKSLGLSIPSIDVNQWLEKDIEMPVLGKTDREFGLVLGIEFILLLYLGLSLLDFVPFF